MKKFVKIAGCLSLATTILLIACRKDNKLDPLKNNSPIARAGTDTTIMLVSCQTQTRSFMLNGSATSDPDNNINSYSWRQISGPSSIRMANDHAATTDVSGLGVGHYLFELTVSDDMGLSSNDTINVTVEAPASVHDLHLDVNGTVEFFDNTEFCPWDCYYSDETTISAVGSIPSLGNLTVSLIEDVDTAQLSYNGYCNSTFQLNSNRYAVGNCKLNLKKLMQEGGGPFSGTLQLTGGSAKDCNVDIFTNSTPLTITGTLDTATHTVNMHIEGKIFF